MAFYLRGTASLLPKGVRGVKVLFERIPDDSGICLIVTLIADCPLRPGWSPQLNYGSRVVVGQENFGCGSRLLAGFGNRNVTLSDIDWSECTKNLRRALAAPPNAYLWVQAHCSEVR
jgi:hypothetical protein